MKFARKQSIVVLLIVCFLSLHGLVGATLQEEPDTDIATRIYELARSLHYENTERGTFTIWVNGDIGGDLTARRTAVKGGEPLTEFELAFLDTSTDFKTEGIDEILPVYPEGPVTLRLPVRVTGDGNAQVTMSYMACSAFVCLPPTTNTLDINLSSC